MERVTQTMGVTISTHNGTSVSRQHNIRNPKVVSKEPHIDPNGLHETWVDEQIQQAYDRLFGAALAEYNAKQTRPERIKSNYYKEVCEKGNGQNPCYEMIIGVYGKNADGSPICSAATGKAIMREFFEDWKERNPNLEIIGAYYHADEPDAEPHLHIDYVPVAHGYKRGLETQAGLVKALGEQGFYTTSKKETAQIQWERRENDYLTSLCEAHGLTVDHPRIENAEHLDTATKKAKTAAESAREEQRIEEQQLKEAQHAVDELDRKVCDLQDEFHSKKKELQGLEQDIAALSSRKQDIEREITAAADTIAEKKQELTALDKQYDEAAKGLEKVLDMKARAAEIKKPFFGGETVSYHKNMLESTRAIGSEAYDELTQANKARKEAAKMVEEVHNMQRSVKPLYDKANKSYLQAEQEKKKQEQLTREKEREIEQRAQALTDKRMQEMFNGAPTAREKRLEAFCDNVRFNDGSSVLDAFIEQEETLKKGKFRGR